MNAINLLPAGEKENRRCTLISMVTGILIAVLIVLKEASNNALYNLAEIKLQAVFVHEPHDA